MIEQVYKIGDRIEKMCAVCGEERGHMVAGISKRNQVSRVTCPKCGTASAFKINQTTLKKSAPLKASATYDRARTYKTGQTMLHPNYGEGEVTAVIEDRKIDVLFTDRLRRLIHSFA
jgi:transcription elongation factor Elf1